MGSSLSSVAAARITASEPSLPLEPGLGDLPESCVASVLVNLQPPQICRLALLNRAFRGASSADFVWESKLPVNYVDIIGRVLGEYSSFSTSLCKRDIYSRLCRANSFDGGTKKVWLDESSGKICISVSSMELTITGVGGRRYWCLIPTDESMFSSVAYLEQIWLFEVDGEIEFPFPPGSYSIFFRLQLGRTHKRFGRRVCNLKHVHGWDKKPVLFKLWTSDGQQARKQCYLKEQGMWINYHAGDFVVGKSCRLMKIKFLMTQIGCIHNKGGLCVDSVVIYPVE